MGNINVAACIMGGEAMGILRNIGLRVETAEKIFHGMENNCFGLQTEMEALLPTVQRLLKGRTAELIQLLSGNQASNESLTEFFPPINPEQEPQDLDQPPKSTPKSIGLLTWFKIRKTVDKEFLAYTETIQRFLKLYHQYTSTYANLLTEHKQLRETIGRANYEALIQKDVMESFVPEAYLPGTDTLSLSRLRANTYQVPPLNPLLRTLPAIDPQKIETGYLTKTLRAFFRT